MAAIRLLILAIYTLPAGAGVTVTFEHGEFDVAVNGLDGAVVYLQPATPVTAAVGGTYAMSQQNRQFSPYIKVVPRGAQVNFPNRDPVAHHVYSFSPTNPFELPLYKGGSLPGVPMETAGVVTVGCNVHDWMIGYIYVVDTPYFAQVSGLQAEIESVPPGNYTLGAWHPDLDPRESVAVAVAVDGRAQAVTVPLRYPVRVRPQPRAPDEQFDEMENY